MATPGWSLRSMTALLHFPLAATQSSSEHAAGSIIKYFSPSADWFAVSITL